MLVVTIYSLDVACAECCSNRCCSYFYFSTGCIVTYQFLRNKPWDDCNHPVFSKCINSAQSPKQYNIIVPSTSWWTSQVSDPCPHVAASEWKWRSHSAPVVAVLSLARGLTSCQTSETGVLGAPECFLICQDL